MSTSLDYEKLVQRKNNFYRDQFRRMVGLLIVLLFICAALVLGLVFLTWTSPKAKYYASTTTGNVIPIQSLSSPVVTLPFVEQWAGMVVRRAYALNFLSYDKQLSEVKKYFTADGWEKFQGAINNSGFLGSLKQDKLDISTIVNGPIVPVNRYVDHGHFTWVIQVPVLLLYTSASQQVKKQFYVTLTIKRVSEMEVPRGISVTDFVSHGQLS